MKNKKLHEWIFIFQKICKFWSVSLEHFIKHKPLNSKEWCWNQNLIFYHTWFQSAPATSETSLFSWWCVQVICWRQTCWKYIVIQFQWRRQFKDYPVIVTCNIIIFKIRIWNYSLNASHLNEKQIQIIKLVIIYYILIL